MALYDGVPSIRLEGDRDRALAFIPEAKVLLYKTQELLKRAKVGTFSMTQRVNGGYIYVLCAESQNIINISIEPDVVDETYTLKTYPYTLFPEFYSGFVTSVPLRYVEIENELGQKRQVAVCPAFYPTPDCIESHPRDGLVPGRQQVRRLAVEPHVFLSELKNQTDSGQVYHQYGYLRSSMYSGLMRKVAQITMGLGRIIPEKLRDPALPADHPVSKYIADVARAGVQMRFDYKWVRTHGVTIAADGRPWLVEISLFRGVIAMPLPIFPGSTSEVFKENARRRKDDAMGHALDDLGWIPTGESFPFGGIEKQIASGDILQLLSPDEVGEFYDHYAYSSSLGWAFSPDGREAHSTGWRYDADHIQSGVWYQINISIGASVKKRKKDQPIAPASASLRKIREGRIYCSPAGMAGTRSQYLPFKFYEPMLEGLVSHFATPDAPTSGKLPISDTPVFVSFVNNTLKVVSYFHDPEIYERGEPKSMQGEFGNCLYAGEWELIQGDHTTLPRMMYTNDYDYRREVQTNYRKETRESIDLGYKGAAAYGYPGFSDHWATGLRYKGFANKTTFTVDIDENVVGVVIIPRFCREAFYFATADWEGKYVPPATPGVPQEPSSDPLATLTREWLETMRDPHFYSMFSCGTYGETNFDFIPDHILDSVPDRLKCRGGETCPFISYNQEFHPLPSRVINHYYFPESPCAAQYADEGSWLESCESLEQPTGADQFVGYDRRTMTTYPFRQSSALFLVTQGSNSPIQIDTDVSRVGAWWNSVSPDRQGNYQQLTVTYSAIGDDCVVYDTAPHDDPTRVQIVTGYLPAQIQPLVYPAFVGVNIA